MRELRENSGSQFDPVVVDAFLKLLNEGAVARRPELPQAPSPGWQFDRPPLPELESRSRPIFAPDARLTDVKALLGARHDA